MPSVSLRDRLTSALLTRSGIMPEYDPSPVSNYQQCAEQMYEAYGPRMAEETQELID